MLLERELERAAGRVARDARPGGRGHRAAGDRAGAARATAPAVARPAGVAARRRRHGGADRGRDGGAAGALGGARVPRPQEREDRAPGATAVALRLRPRARRAGDARAGTPELPGRRPGGGRRARRGLPRRASCVRHPRRPSLPRAARPAAGELDRRRATGDRIARDRRAGDREDDRVDLEARARSPSVAIPRTSSPAPSTGSRTCRARAATRCSRTSGSPARRCS